MLARRGWLSMTPPAFRDAWLEACHWRHFSAGDSVTYAGDPAGDVLGIAEGLLALASDLGPADSPTVALMHPGEWFGYVPLVAQRTRTLSTVARSPLMLAFMPEAQVRRRLNEHPGDWQHLALLTSIGLQQGANIAMDLLIRNSRRRFVAALLRAGDVRFAAAGAGSAEVYATQDEVAAMANLSRSTACDILGTLADSGLISRGYHSITLTNVDALRGIVDADG